MHNRNWANRILAGVFALFILASVLKYRYTGMFAADLFFTVSEAALVGGIADWFAVTALFRKPLGFPWHTALIPRNRARVVRSIVETVEQDLLSVEAIKRRLADVCFMNIFIDWVENKNGKMIVGSFVATAAQHFLETVDIDHLSARAERFARRYLKDWLPSKFQTLGHWAVNQGKIENLFEFMIEELMYVIQKPDTVDAAYKYLKEVKEEKAGGFAARFILWFGEQTNSVNLRDAAQALQKEVLIMLNDLRDPRHPIHKWAVSRLAENVCCLEQDENIKTALTAWVDNVIGQISLRDILERTRQSAADSLKYWTATGGRQAEHPPLMLWIFDQAAAYWHSFKEDQDIHYWVERYVKKALFRLIETEHHFIGGVVQNALGDFDNDGLNEFIEEKAGDDLQWIRINGCVVGGLVGLLLFIFLRFIYDPYFVPLLRSWVM